MTFALESEHIPNQIGNTLILEHIDFLAWTR